MKTLSWRARIWLRTTLLILIPLAALAAALAAYTPTAYPDTDYPVPGGPWPGVVLAEAADLAVPSGGYATWLHEGSLILWHDRNLHPPDRRTFGQVRADLAAGILRYDQLTLENPGHPGPAYVRWVSDRLGRPAGEPRGPLPPLSIRWCESRDRYGAQNPLGAAGGWQIVPGTRDTYAVIAGRPDLVGVDLTVTNPLDQDVLASVIYNWGAGRGHWVC